MWHILSLPTALTHCNPSSPLRSGFGGEFVKILPRIVETRIKTIKHASCSQAAFLSSWHYIVFTQWETFVYLAVLPSLNTSFVFTKLLISRLFRVLKPCLLFWRATTILDRLFVQPDIALAMFKLWTPKLAGKSALPRKSLNHTGGNKQHQPPCNMWNASVVCKLC